VIAYKFLRAGAVGPFSGFAWPVPADGRQGAWVDAAGRPRACERGVHACARADLPVWLDEELWVVELGGSIVNARTKLVAERGRLVRRVAAWNPALAAAFAAVCAERARGFAPEYGDDAERLVVEGAPATTAYVAAHAAARAFGSPAGAVAERAWQADWLATALAL
jgi:hypothetical protein